MCTDRRRFDDSALRRILPRRRGAGIRLLIFDFSSVIPAQAGIQYLVEQTPKDQMDTACAGMTEIYRAKHAPSTVESTLDLVQHNRKLQHGYVNDGLATW